MQFPKSKKKEDEGAKAAKLKEEQRLKSVNKQKTKRMKSYCLARILIHDSRKLNSKRKACAPT